MASVLLVEDEVLIRVLLEEAFEEKEIEVQAAHDGVAAQRLLESASPTILVTDVNLGPGPDGFEVARRGRELNPELRVIYVTAHAAHRAHEGVAGSKMISKPFDPGELAGEVAAILALKA